MSLELDSAVVHIATINSAKVRFFAPPVAGAEFAWVSLVDAVLASRFPARKADFVTGLQADYPSSARHVRTADGLEIIVAFWLANAIFNASILVGKLKPEVLGVFSRHAAAASLMMVGGELGPAEAIYFERAAERQDAALERFAR